MARTTLHLAKENFKFSSAHFLIFDETHAERLHGHNYRVRVDLEIDAKLDLKDKGFFVDFNVFKQEIKRLVDLWDERVLLPAGHPEMKIQRDGSHLNVAFRERSYRFPADEVVQLPITNTSVEQLSRLLAEAMAPGFAAHGVRVLQVLVEETPGQGASIRLEI